MEGQLCIFDFLSEKRRITPIKSKRINVFGNLIPIKVGEVYEIFVKHCDMVSIRIYNSFGGSFWFPVTYDQMKESFRELN